MLTAKLKELDATRSKLAALEEAIAMEMQRELRRLPARYGFSSVDAFAAAVRRARGGRGGTKPARRSSAAPRTPARHRATITDETRAQVKKMVQDGRTGPEIAGLLGISRPSVQNIKKALGLVRSR